MAAARKRRWREGRWLRPSRKVAQIMAMWPRGHGLDGSPRRRHRDSQIHEEGLLTAHQSSRGRQHKRLVATPWAEIGGPHLLPRSTVAPAMASGLTAAAAMVPNCRRDRSTGRTGRAAASASSGPAIGRRGLAVSRASAARPHDRRGGDGELPGDQPKIAAGRAGSAPAAPSFVTAEAPREEPRQGRPRRQRRKIRQRPTAPRPASRSRIGPELVGRLAR